MSIMWTQVLLSSILFYIANAQFNFGTVYDFELSSDVIFPRSGDDVTFTCRRTDRYKRKTSQNFIDQGDRITWEVNDRTVFMTEADQDNKCKVSEDSNFFRRPTFGNDNDPVRYPNISCEDDGTSATLTIHDWRPHHIHGDRWRCMQFPFAESAKLEIQSFVPASQVFIKQVIDKGNNRKPARGTFVTCKASPCRPPASIDWFLVDGDSDVMITSQAEVQEQVDTGRNGLSVTTSAVLFTSDTDHGLTVYCKTSNSRDVVPVESTNVTLTIVYPPEVNIRVVPESNVLEGSDVTMYCSAIGRPPPEIKWIWKKETDTGVEDVLVSFSPSVSLTDVKLTDSGEYVCTASNKLEPDASAKMVLFVRENVVPIDSSMTRSTGSSQGGKDSDNSVDAGAVAGGIIAAIIITVLIAVIVYLFLRQRWSKQESIGTSSGRRSYDESEGHGVYATCSTLPRASQLPPYLEVLPPDQKISKVTNPGYGMDDMIIAGTSASHRANANRPLPSTPLDCDSGYEEIEDPNVAGVPKNDAPGFNRSTGSRARNEAPRQIDVTYCLANDGYEMPVAPRSLSAGDLGITSAVSPSYQNTHIGGRRFSEIASRERPLYKPKSSSKERAKSLHAKRESLYKNENDFDTTF